jgi:hypothetical protein
LEEVTPIGRFLKSASIPPIVDARLGVETIKEYDLIAETAEAKYKLQVEPG